MKKKLMKLSTFMFILFVAFMPVVYADDFTCGVFGESIQIDTMFAKITSMIIMVIKVVVPILLIIWGMLDLAKAIISQKEDEIKKGQHTFIKRLIAAVIVFFVVAVVTMVISFVAGDENDQDIIDCMNCFINGADSQSCK